MPKKHTVFVTRRIPQEGLALLKARKDIVLRIAPQDEPISRDALLKNVRGVRGIISLLTDRIDAEVLDAAGDQLKIVANYAVGYDNIDIAECAKRGVTVTNTPGVLTDAVAEHAIALIMAIARRIPESDRFMREGKYEAWAPMLLLGSQLKGKTLGIIGSGRIGMEVATRATYGLSMQIVYSDVERNSTLETACKAKYMSLATLMEKADVISVHVPLLPTTHHLLNKDMLRRMKRTAYIVNTSRGAVIDEKALVQALASKRIAGAALDVFEHEPMLTPGLKELGNVVLTPHTASATHETRSAMSVSSAQAILAVIDGKKPKHRVRNHI